MSELVEASFRSLALGIDRDLDPGLWDVTLDHLKTLVVDTGGGYAEFKGSTVLFWDQRSSETPASCYHSVMAEAYRLDM